jgi:hypothetical protein
VLGHRVHGILERPMMSDERGAFKFMGPDRCGDIFSAQLS